MKAMILAAGRGERLRPLSDARPKPLAEAGGKALLARHLERLAQAGFAQVVINVSHLADQIIERFGDGRRYGLEIAWSRESEALETAGGIAHARALLGAEPFLLVNADLHTDYDFARLRGRALGEALAHLVLVPRPAHRADGDFSLAGGRVGNAAAPRYTYAGIALVAPALVAAVGSNQRAPLAPLLREAAGRGLVSGELYTGHWRDIGTRERLEELDQWLRGQQGAKSNRT
jgi:MurNAc alpha-1-phosphate uridylyltransferase